MSGNRLLIVGASGRAAAASAIRAGFEPFVIDLFADADTRRLCLVLKCEMPDYPAGLVRLAERAPPGPWMYTGGLENHPEVIEAISATRELRGNRSTELRLVRNPGLVASALDGTFGGHGEPRLEHPRFAWLHEPPPAGTRWLLKPVRGGGGARIRFLTDADRADLPRLYHDYYVQEFLDGPSHSVVYRSDSYGAWVQGSSRQLIGEPWLHARPFAYCGSVTGGPDTERIADACLGHAIRFSELPRLFGVWGFDFIWKDARPYLLEINPRYTASVEVLEHSSGVPALGPARGACPTKPVGKAIYYAPGRLTFPTSGPWDESLRRCTDVWRRPDYADIPDPGAVVEAGHPVVTLLADGGSEAAVLDTLKERAAELDGLFGFGTPRDVK